MLENITLSQEQQQIIFGGLLGDAYFNPKRKIIRFSHSIKQEEYLNWKYSFFDVENINGIYTRQYKEGYRNKYFELTNKNKQIDILSDYFKKYLYSNDGRKKISLKYLKNIDAFGLAIWWMDDGMLSIHKGNRYGKLCTECFNYEEQILLQKYFKDFWNISVDIKSEKNKYYFLRFNVGALRKLITIIYPYVCMVPSMIYKIDLDYANQKCIGDLKEIYNYIKSHRQNNVLITSTLTTAGCA